MPSLKTKGSSTGTLVDPINNQIMVYESTGERSLAYILCTDHRVASVWDQPSPVSYIDDAGHPRSHTFDFLAVLHDRRRIAYAVKPEAKVVSSGIERTLDLIRTQVGPRFADAFVLRTERHITKERTHNARLILHSHAARNEAHVERILEITRTLVGSARIGDIAARSGLEGYALRAIACLIGDGYLRLTRPACIAHSAFVSRAALSK